MTARVINVHDPSSNSPSDDVANDAINSEINERVVVVKGSSGCRVVRMWARTENRTRPETGVQGAMYNRIITVGTGPEYVLQAISRLSLYHSLGPGLAMLLGSYACKERLFWPEPQTRAGEGIC